MTSPFNWQAHPREVPKEFKTRNDKPGTLPPIILAGTPKWVAPKNQKRPK